MTRDSVNKVVSPKGRRLELLRKIETAVPGQKVNSLAAGLTADEMEELTDLTRERYLTMESAVMTLKVLDAALIKHFVPQDAQQLRDLARHAIGLYLNTHQYHNAVHALSMTREALHLAQTAGITDPETLRTLVIQGLYHDAGNGIKPEPANSREADEAQAAEIFMKDVREAKRRIAQGEPLGALSALGKLSEVTVAGKNHPQETVIIACIASTVFRDRFVAPKGLALEEYMCAILEHGHGVEKDKSTQDVYRLQREMVDLMESTPAWIARDADIVGSTRSPYVFYNHILNRVEDTRRGLAKGVRPKKYHAGFVGFIGASFHSGQETEAVKTAKAGSPLYLPKEQGGGDQVAVIEYGKKQLQEENRRFDTLLKEHEPMLNALFVLIGEADRDGEKILEMPLKTLRARLTQLAGDPRRVERAQQILTDEPPTSFELDLSGYPLLGDPRYAHMSLAEMTPGLMNRIFAPNAQQTQRDESVMLQLETLEQQARPDEQPVLLSLLELANIYPELFTESSLAAGKHVIHKDTKPEYVYIILEGSADIHLPTGVKTVGKGAVLGEISALSGKNAMADVIANTNLELLALPASLVEEAYPTEELRLKMLELAERRLGYRL